MKRRSFLFPALPGVLSWCSFKSSMPVLLSQGTSKPNLTELEDLLPALMREFSIPGMSIAVLKAGSLYWTRSFGVRQASSRLPIDRDTLFEAASVSKTVFAYAVMHLCQESVLDLDKPLVQFFPVPFLAEDKRSNEITARQVLSHTTGLQDWRSGASPLRFHFNPGEQFLYSGEAYHYLQSVVSRLTGTVDRNTCARYEADYEVCATDFDPLMKRLVLGPLGMPSSSYLWNQTLEQNAALPHDSNGKSLPKQKPSATDVARYGAAGGLHTSASEYARFLAEIVNPSAPGSFRLGSKMWTEMRRPQIKLKLGSKVDGADSWALGWGVKERKEGNILVHSGGQSGFRSLATACVERKTGFIILTNADSGDKLIHHAKLSPFLDGIMAAEL